MWKLYILHILFLFKEPAAINGDDENQNVIGQIKRRELMPYGNKKNQFSADNNVIYYRKTIGVPNSEMLDSGSIENNEENIKNLENDIGTQWDEFAHGLKLDVDDTFL